MPKAASMSTTASDPLLFAPYPTLCPWFTVISVRFAYASRIQIEHSGAKESFDVSAHELETQFASVFTRALKIKHAMITAEKVANALAYDTKPDSVQNDEC